MLINSIGQYDYSAERVMARRFIFEPVMLCLYPEIKVMSASSLDIGKMSKEQRSEMCGFARSYTEKMLITGYGDETLIICPTMFPSSSLCLALRMLIPTKELLRLAELCAPEMFEVSKYIGIEPARMSESVRKHSELFSSLCEELKLCFTGLGGAMSDVWGEDIVDICLRISRFTGCPIELLAEDGFDVQEMKNVDLYLFCAFVLDMLLLARRHSVDRSATVSLRTLYSSPFIEVAFDGDTPLCTLEEYYQWKNIAYERDMPLYLHGEGGSAVMSMHFYRVDPALLGLKAPIMLRQSLPRWMI